MRTTFEKLKPRGAYFRDYKESSMNTSSLNAYRKWSCLRNMFLKNRGEINKIYSSQQRNFCVSSSFKRN